MVLPAECYRCHPEQPRTLHLHQGEKPPGELCQHDDHVSEEWEWEWESTQHNISLADLFRLDTAHRLVRSVLINWRVLCLMKDENPLSKFGIERDMVNANTKMMQYFRLRESAKRDSREIRESELE